MTQSKTTVAGLLECAMADLGLYKTPDRGFFRDLLSDCLGRLYTEYLCERAVLPLDTQTKSITLSTLTGSLGAPVCCEDVMGVVFGDGQTATYLAPDAFWALGDSTDLSVYTLTDTELLLSRAARGARLVYSVRPARLLESDEGNTLPLPEEYMPMLAAYLRGEAYKAVNDDALAAKWLGEYNQRLGALCEYAAALRRRRGGGASV